MEEYKFQISDKDENGRIIVARGNDVKTLILDLEELKAKLKPVSTVVSEKAVVINSEDIECPKCGNNLIEAETKTGKKFTKCSTNKWNFELKKAEGCDFVKWD